MARYSGEKSVDFLRAAFYGDMDELRAASDVLCGTEFVGYSMARVLPQGAADKNRVAQMDAALERRGQAKLALLFAAFGGSEDAVGYMLERRQWTRMEIDDAFVAALAGGAGTGVVRMLLDKGAQCYGADALGILVQTPDDIFNLVTQYAYDGHGGKKLHVRLTGHCLAANRLDRALRLLECADATMVDIAYRHQGVEKSVTYSAYETLAAGILKTEDRAERARMGDCFDLLLSFSRARGEPMGEIFAEIIRTMPYHERTKDIALKIMAQPDARKAAESTRPLDYYAMRRLADAFINDGDNAWHAKFMTWLVDIGVDGRELLYAAVARSHIGLAGAALAAGADPRRGDIMDKAMDKADAALVSGGGSAKQVLDMLDTARVDLTARDLARFESLQAQGITARGLGTANPRGWTYLMSAVMAGKTRDIVEYFAQGDEKLTASLLVQRDIHGYTALDAVMQNGALPLLFDFRLWENNRAEYDVFWAALPDAARAACRNHHRAVVESSALSQLKSNVTQASGRLKLRP